MTDKFMIYKTDYHLNYLDTFRF